MNDQYEQAKDLFLEACAMSGSDRAALLDRQCGGAPALRKDVESLLAEFDRTPESKPQPSDMPTLQDGRRVGAPDQPERIGAYRILHEIARGGMGIVYLARDDRFNRRVAVKVVKRGMDTVEVLKRFDQERQLLAALNHPGIARLYDGGETEDGVAYFAMEFVEGRSIDEYCDTHRLRIAERLALFRKVCEAVHYAHQNLVVHRDLKPSNILVTEDGQPKLLDFGIAKLVNPEISRAAGDPTRPELRVMTPEYASPEQIRAEPLTTNSDVYSLGVLLYELVCGHRPYHLTSHARADIERAVCETDPDKPSTAVSWVESPDEAETVHSDSTRTITPESVSAVRAVRPDRLRKRLAGDIDNIVLMALRKEPQRRYISAADFAEDLRRHLEGLTVMARADTFSYRFSKFVRRNKIGVAAAAMVALSLVGGIFGTSWQATVAAVEREEAVSAKQRAESRFEAGLEVADALIGDIHDSVQQLSGSTEARRLILETAEGFLDDLQKEGFDTVQLKRTVASMYDHVGELYGGDRNPILAGSDLAAQNRRIAFDLRQVLADEYPEDDGIRREFGISCIGVGDLRAKRGDVRGALSAYREAVAIGEWLVERNPQGLDTRRFFAVALAEEGQMLQRTGDLTGALERYERSLPIRRSVLDDYENDADLREMIVDGEGEAADLNRRLQYARGVSVGLNRIGQINKRLGNYDRALSAYEESIDIRRRIQRMRGFEEDIQRTDRDLAVARLFAGEVLLMMGEPARALPHLQAYLDSSVARVEKDPQDVRSRLDVAYAHDFMGQARLKMDDTDAAYRHFQDFHLVAAELLELDDIARHRSLRARSLQRLGETAVLRDQLAEALEFFESAVDDFQYLLDDDDRDMAARIELAIALNHLGAVRIDTDRFDEAREALDQARRELTRVLDADDGDATAAAALERTEAMLEYLDQP